MDLEGGGRGGGGEGEGVEGRGGEGRGWESGRISFTLDPSEALQNGCCWLGRLTLCWKKFGSRYLSKRRVKGTVDSLHVNCTEGGGT